MRATGIFVGLASLLFLGVELLSARAPEPSSATAPEIIAIGQSLDGAMEILRRRGIEFREGGFSFMQGNPDISNLHFTLDADHTVVCLFFSRSRHQVTGLSTVFHPSRREHAKSTESWLSAQALYLYPDTSYAVHFSKPATKEELDRRDAEITRRTSNSPASPAGSKSGY